MKSILNPNCYYNFKCAIYLVHHIFPNMLFALNITSFCKMGQIMLRVIEE